jgi:hypothetical protein
MNSVRLNHRLATTATLLALCAVAPTALGADVPGTKFDLSQWKLTLPLDENNDGQVDEIDTKALKNYSHKDFFYLNEKGHMVFTAPNVATTTSGSTNTRSELRQMLRGSKTKISTHDPRNNFALKTHPLSRKFAMVGGKLEATVYVSQVATRAKYAEKPPAFSVVVGQIHADKGSEELKKKTGFGWGNEPIKIYYKKWPNHSKGSVFWSYERNLAKDNPNRIDIAYPVWGNTWENPAEPGDKGVALNEEFSYVINVYQDIMYLTFTSPRHETVKYEINLANNVDAKGKVDNKDHPYGYLGDALYFKAGAYNQCSSTDKPGSWYAACPGTGDWQKDKAAGDYASVTFTRLSFGASEKPL